MPASTPIARTKTAALARVNDCAAKGYLRCVMGEVAAEKAQQMVAKLHLRHAIGATPGQRAVRKAAGKANAVLAVYWPEDAARVAWMMLFTAGALDSSEPQLRMLASKPRPQWLGYELVRRAGDGQSTARAAWTWRRPRQEMSEHFALLQELLRRRDHAATAALLQRLAHQPGFHGVREQTRRLCQAARHGGYAGGLPQLFYVQKVSHGERMELG